MKKFILSLIAVMFLAASFPSYNPPPGWYQVPLPVNKVIYDICFADTLNGWICTQSIGKADTAYILKTTDGGDNWNISLIRPSLPIFKLQFFDSQLGYAGTVDGNGYGTLLKTTNGGDNWIPTPGFMQGIGNVRDISFLNKDTGWVCDDDFSFGGLIKTTNGGLNWIRQTIPDAKTRFVSFPSYDTGYYAVSTGYLYKSTNSGSNWFQILHPPYGISNIFFINNQKGWINSALTLQSKGVLRTTNGGINWTENTIGEVAGIDMYFINDSVGYSGGGSFFDKIIKTTDGGKIWGYQANPIPKVKQVWALKNNPNYAWAGDTKFARTSDGGGTIIFTGIRQISSSVPTIFKLSQNYPNPFNPTTKIRFDVREVADIKFIIYDIRGKVIQDNRYGTTQPGEYEVEFDANAFALSSGVYFYKLIAINKNSNVFSETKKMLLVK